MAKRTGKKKYRGHGILCPECQSKARDWSADADGKTTRMRLRYRLECRNCGHRKVTTVERPYLRSADNG